MDLCKIGIIRESKDPPDKRVPLTPEQCKQVEKTFPNVKVYVQPGKVRIFKDEEYTAAGIEVKEDLNGCDILLGVKEVKADLLIPEKTYMFFSHTIKMQPYNRKLLKTIVDKKIRLIDYEVIVDSDNRRLIGFGRYAGIAGAYSGFRALGKKFRIYDIDPGYALSGREEMNSQLLKAKLPKKLKIVLTGEGRVAKGALEIIEQLNIRQISPTEILEQDFTEAVFAHLKPEDLYIPRDESKSWDKQRFYNHPEEFKSGFVKFAQVADFFIAGHYWNPKSEVFFTKEDMKSPDFKIKVIADISCDINGPIPSTVRPSTITEPFYGYEPIEEKETDFYNEDAIGVMAVDNLPCELPKDASEGFGNELIENVFPHLLGEDKSGYMENATITQNGELTHRFVYLDNYLNNRI